jgi:murein DD-endopeptidase MepM/ murein hydrolase activator NlpD
MRAGVPLKRFLYLLFVLLGCLSLAAPPASAGKTPSPSKLKRQANQAAARYSRALATYNRLGDEIGKLERQVTKLEARLAPMREAVTRRALTLYKGDMGLDAVAILGGGGDPLRSARGARMVAQASTRDMVAIEAIKRPARQLRERRSALEDRRHEQQQALQKLESERRDVEMQLAIQLRAQAAFQSRLVAAARTSPRASRAPKPPRQRQAAVAPAGPVQVGSFICPIRGPLAFTDDWGAPRPGGRRHKGVDLMSPKGTDNVAAVAGTIESRHWGGGGLTLFLDGDDGHTYVYMHLFRVIGPEPRHVEQGELVGLTGASGNASAYHTHFEFHPGRGDAVNPYSLLSGAC